MEYVDSIQRWMVTLPDYDIYVHNVEARERLFRLEWPEFPHLNLVRRCIRHSDTMTTNLWRMLLLYQYGGVYTHVLYSPGPSLKELTINLSAEAFFLMNDSKDPVDSLFGLKAGHPIAHFAVTSLLAKMIQMRNFNRKETKLRSVTGPEALGNAYRQYVGDDDSNTTAFTLNTTIQTVSFNENAQIVQQVEGKQDALQVSPNDYQYAATSESCLEQLYSFVTERLEDDATTGLEANASSTATSLQTNPTASLKLSLRELTQSDQTLVSCPTPLVPVYDRIVDTDETPPRKHRRIPRILHLSHKSRCVPVEFADAVERWKVALPNHSVYFHDDAAVQRLLGLDWPEFPQLRTILRCVQYNGAMLIDIWRLLVVYRYGGIYTDIDNWPGSDMNENALSDDAEAFFLTTATGKPTQWFFAMEPAHPMAFYSMAYVLMHVADLEHMEDPELISVTGPGTVHKAYTRFVLRNVGRGQTQNDTYRGTHGKSLVRIPYEVSDNFVLSSLGGTMNDEGRWGGKDSMSRRDRIHRDMNMVHWSDKSKRDEHNVTKGTCRHHLYRLDAEDITWDNFES